MAKVRFSSCNVGGIVKKLSWMVVGEVNEVCFDRDTVQDTLDF